MPMASAAPRTSATALVMLARAAGGMTPSRASRPLRAWQVDREQPGAERVLGAGGGRLLLRGGGLMGMSPMLVEIRTAGLVRGRAPGTVALAEACVSCVSPVVTARRGFRCGFGPQASRLVVDR